MVVPVECPSLSRYKFLGHWLGYIVEQGSPTEPQVVGHPADGVQYGQRVIEIVFMTDPVHGFHAFESR